jgi:nucleoside-diphosphate-sugar epimerase
MSSGLVLVTGAGGFIGRALVTHFAAAGRAHRALYRNRVPAEPALPADRFVADLASCAEPALDAMLAGVTAVVHLAGRAHVLAETAADPEAEFLAANVLATGRLARAAVRAGAARFLLASTVKVNGETTAPGRPFVPADPPAPQDPYARSKLAAERALAEACADTPLAPIVLRLPLVYGPGVGGNFAVLQDAIARGRPLPLGAVANRRSLLYVGNLVEAIDAALDVPTPPRGVHFVADERTVSVPDLARAIAAAQGVALELRRVPVPLLRLAAALTGRGARVHRLVDSLVVDTGSFLAATGYRPRHGLADGLAATAARWQLQHAL